MIKFVVPVKTRNPLNGAQGRTKGAVFAKAARRKKEREAARLCMLAAAPPPGYFHSGVVGHLQGGPQILPGRTVTLIRVSAGTLDGDGLQAALKSVRDGVADALGINDGSNAVSWEYAQRKGKRGEGSVEVEIT